MKNGSKFALQFKNNRYACSERIESNEKKFFSFPFNSELEENENDAIAYRAIALYCLKKAEDLETSTTVYSISKDSILNQCNKAIEEKESLLFELI